MVSTRKGITKKHASSQKLLQFFESREDLNGVFYIGYPILFSSIESKTVDALWISKEHGIVIFDLVESGPVNAAERIDNQDEIIIRLESLLNQYSELRNRRDLLVKIESISFAPNSQKIDISEVNIFYSLEELSSFIDVLLPWNDNSLYEKTLSVIQSVTKLKTDGKREYVKKSDSKGKMLKDLEQTTAFLDNEQEKAIIEYFGGVQRIRGLAGSGKTIILALKAAYLYSQNPEWKIAVTFNTRALKNQFKELIERFVVEKKGELPNWENIQIIHAWGNSSTEGILDIS